MQNLVIGGVDKEYTPISNAFKIEIINKELYFKFNILQITNIKVNIENKFIDSFKSMGVNYSNILIAISIRVDYICEERIVKYQVFEESTICCICTQSFNLIRNTSIYTGVLDAGIFNISLNKIHLYVLYCCSLEV